MAPFLKYIINRLIIILLLMTTMLSFNFSANAAEPKRIALLPFKINAEKDMSFLQNGIFDMLTSRLAKEGEVIVTSRQEAEDAFEAAGSPDPVTESVARTIGAGLNADYTLFGSITVLGNSISIDAKMVDVSGKTPTASFFDQSQDLGGIITKVNQIATQINATVFGRRPEVAQKAAPTAPSAPAEPAAKQAPADDVHAHPEKLVKGRGGIEGEGSPFIVPGTEDESAFQKFWRSASFKHVINGLALGDVDQDGKIETVVATPSDLIIYRAEGGKFYKTQEVKMNTDRINIGLDIADINDNGYPEIFVTSLNGTRLTIQSSVFEYDGTSFIRIVDNSPWYYRVCDVPGRGKILLGQKHRVAKPFAGPIYDMIWQNSHYEPESEIKTPRTIQVMGVALGDVLDNKQETAVAFKQSDRLQLIDIDGEQIWQSSEKFGGSTVYSVGEKKTRGDVENPLYYPVRLLVTDSNNDGETEVIVVKNHEVAGRKLERFRKYTNAHFESLQWDGLGLAVRWKTRKISGFVRDYAIADFDNDGKLELVAAVIISEGTVVLVGEPKSTIIAYELPS
jgi:TolB-like protein